MQPIADPNSIISASWPVQKNLWIIHSTPIVTMKSSPPKAGRARIGRVWPKRPRGPGAKHMHSLGRRAGTIRRAVEQDGVT